LYQPGREKSNEAFPVRRDGTGNSTDEEKGEELFSEKLEKASDFQRRTDSRTLNMGYIIGRKTQDAGPEKKIQKFQKNLKKALDKDGSF